MKQYLELVQHILDNGERRKNRTGVDTLAVFGTQTKYDLRLGFPLLTTKKMLFEKVVLELLWFIRGESNIAGLGSAKNLWEPWADSHGELGPIYGVTWRHWPLYVPASRSQEGWSLYRREEIDQLVVLLEQIKANPDSRRHILSAWNVSELHKMALQPCHMMAQFNVVNGQLDCMMFQRSADTALGVPFNVASYALLTHLIAIECGLSPGVFTHSIGDAHIYVNHIEGLKEQLKREPKAPPDICIQKKPFFYYGAEDISLHNYKHDPFIKFEVAV
jgi:thymidylate synthase